MISNLSPTSQLLLADMSRIQQQFTDADLQVSSGKKLNVASDSPADVQPVLQLRAEQARNKQIQSNLTEAQTEATSADSALSSSITLLDNAVSLGTQGASDTQTAETRQTLAQQVESILEEMVSYSQTQVQGRYIFSGDQSQSPTYQVDLSSANGVDQLSQAPATQQVEDPAGGSFAATKTAKEIFDDTNADGTPAADNVFAALTSLRTALLNNDQPRIANAVISLQTASDHLNSMDEFYGTVENRIQDATTFASNYDTKLTQQLSDKQDADVTSAAMALTQASTEMQAAMTMQGKTPHTTLFDFLG
jgi:flagellar hook-associated protein 3 FlgL